ncbi:hypothetical protein BGZ76_006225 [Entomortierella beljakovae]|nr:hypothetical protein BGZ76_006225 [Entomortierella beljakovae]
MASIPIPKRYRTVIYIPSRHDGCMLEVCLSIPLNTSSQPQSYTGVVIAHPYGPLGGSYNNNVVGALMQWFETQSLQVMNEDVTPNVPSSPTKKTNGNTNSRQQDSAQGASDTSDSTYVLLKSPKMNRSGSKEALPLSCIVCAFNFRGCGKSKGRTSWFGEAERGDYQTIVDLLQSGPHPGSTNLENGERRDSGISSPTTWSGKAYDETGSEINLPRIPFLSRFILCGYSYGGMIASTIPPPLKNPLDPTSDHLPTSYVLVSYPAGVSWFLTSGSHGSFSRKARSILSSDTNPRPSTSSTKTPSKETVTITKKKQPPVEAFFITGTQDQFTGLKTLLSWLKTNTGINPPKQPTNSGSWSLNRPDGNIRLEVIEGADHFWSDQELVLLDKLQNWWSENHQ